MDRDYLIVYVDGIQFGGRHMLAALGVDEEGNKRVLGIREGASENAVVALGLLESLVERGLDPGRVRLFVLDGAKVLRKAVGPGLREYLPRAALPEPQDAQRDRPSAEGAPRAGAGRAAGRLERLDAKDGGARIEQFAS